MSNYEAVTILPDGATVQAKTFLPLGQERADQKEGNLMSDTSHQGTHKHTDESALLRIISGRIVLERSGQGVSGLIVEALDVTGNRSRERLGSVCTDELGAFQIEAPLSQLEIPLPFWRYHRCNWKVPFALSRNHQCDCNLQLLVLTPERNSLDRDQRLLFCSEVREQAGRQEHFRIELSAGALETAGLEVQTPGQAASEAAADAITQAHAQAKKLQEAADGVFESKLENVEERKTLFRTAIRERLVQELSEVSEKERTSDRFVPTDDDIRPKHLEAVKTDINTLTEKESDPSTGEQVGKVRLKGRLLLTEEQKQALTGTSDGPKTLSEQEVEEELGVALDKPAAIYRRHLEPDPCRPKTDAERCLEDLVDQNGGPGDEDGGENDEDDQDDGIPPVLLAPSDGLADSNGNRGGVNITFEKDTAVASLMGRQTAPEEPVEFGAEDASLETPLTAGGVSESIDQVVFAPGPADVPAFYDFHDLQIAFAPVWQEALNDKFLEDIERAYDPIVKRGGAPALAKVTGMLNATSGLKIFDRLADALQNIGSAADNEVPASVASAVFISLEEWQILPNNSQNHLSALARRIANLREKLIKAMDPENIPDIGFDLNLGELIRAANTKEAIAFRTQIQLLTADAERIVAHARRLLLERESNEPFKPTHAIIEQLRHRRRQAYPFRYFAASQRYRSVNFGIMVTYRQKWTPVSYQVGELVSTIPLAPKEIRKVNKKTVVKTKRSQKEIESNLQSRKEESEEKSRAEAEIVSRANAKTNFSLSSSGTLNIGGEGPIGGSATMTSTFSRDAETHSQSVKKEFREAILKSAEEYKNERKIEVSTEESFEEEITESGEIQNPNDEIPVTFLFYELQRRFKVDEKIHRLQSVVLVAQEVPPASAIDKEWLIRHDWILNRVLLDDSFRPALTYVSTTLISEEAALKEMREALFRQRKLVEELKEDVADRRVLTGLRYAALQRQIERTAQSADSGGGLFGSLGGLVGGLVGGGVPIVGDIVQGGLDLLTGGGEGPSEEAQIREGAARDAFDRERREEQELASRLQNALSTLEAMQRDYTERLAQHLRQLVQCERLIAHIVQNILHYMQAIWAHEVDDQRFLRLRNVPVPMFEKDKELRKYVINPQAMQAFADIPTTKARSYEVAFDLGMTQPPSDPQAIETKPLSEVADLNRPLGFEGNYIIFPMLESNPITEFMMDPYVTLAEGEYGVSDPDPLGNMTLDEFSEYVCCLKAHFDKQIEEASDDGDDVGLQEVDPFEELKPFLREILKRLLERSLRSNEEVIVPCDCMYIEALPGGHSVMEKFKHLHRQIDVKSAQEDLRREAIDNVRRAQRIMDAQLEDPDIEAKYIFEGDGTATIVSPGNPGGGGGNGS